MLAAANGGKTEAMILIANWYEKGFIVQQNLVQAVLWYEKAEKLGNETAQKALQRLNGALQIKKKPLWRRLFGGKTGD